MAKISDIAKALGLSNATISKALNGSPEIPEATVARVKECARTLGYVPSHFARTLKIHRSFSIGVLFVDKTESGLRHEYFSSILNSIKVEAESKGYDITFISADNYSGLRPTYLQHVRSRAIDGVVIACVDFNDPNVMELSLSDVPTVTIDHTFDGCTSVMSDNEDGVYELTKRAYELGHRKIAFIHGEDTTVTRKRVAGYLRALNELGIEAKDEYMPSARYHDPESVVAAFQRLGKLKDRPTCVLCPDDISAVVLLSSRLVDNKEFLDRVSIAGYDGIYLSRMLKPALTTYCQDSETIGRLAASKLISQIENPKLFVPELIKVKGKLQEGGTIRPLEGILTK